MTTDWISRCKAFSTHLAPRATRSQAGQAARVPQGHRRLVYGVSKEKIGCIVFSYGKLQRNGFVIETVKYTEEEKNPIDILN